MSRGLFAAAICRQVLIRFTLSAVFYSKKTHLDHLVHILRAVSRVGDIGGYTAPPVTYVLNPKDTAHDIGVPLARVIRVRLVATCAWLPV